MPRYGCRKCGRALPKVLAAEAARVQCVNPACGAMNLVPADPAAAREARAAGGSVESSPVLVAQVRPRRVGTAFQVLLGLVFVIVVLMLIPPVRNAAYARYLSYRLSHTDNRAAAQSYCERLDSLGHAAAPAAPVVWRQREKQFADGQHLDELYLARVLKDINPSYLKEVRPVDEQPTGPTDAQKQQSKSLAAAISPSMGVDKLIGYLKHEDAGVRTAAARALGSMGPDAKAAVPALTEEAGHDYSTARADAAKALGAMGADAKEAIPTLVTMSQDFVQRDRHAALDAMEKIAPDDPRVKEAIARDRKQHPAE